MYQIEITDEQACNTKNITFQYTIHPIFITTCAVVGCHIPGGEGNGDYTIYEGIKEKVDNGKLFDMIDTKQMPRSNTPGPKSLTECQIKQIKQWVAEGALNN